MNRLLLWFLLLNPLIQAAAEVPSGTYRLDPSHASLIFRVSHLGFSMYTARFLSYDATLDFNADKLEQSSINVTIDSASIETDFPNPDVIDFNQALQAEPWLDTTNHPRMTWISRSITMTDERSGIITGDLTLRGVTSPVKLTATFNGGYEGHPMDPQARIGFSARGTFNRSDFGMTYGIPEPGTTMGVGDRVEVIVEAEFSGPPLPVEN